MDDKYSRFKVGDNMTDKEKLEMLVMAVRDMQSGVLCDISFFQVVAGIVPPPTPPTKEMIEWALQSIKEHEDDYQRVPSK